MSIVGDITINILLNVFDRGIEIFWRNLSLKVY